MMFKPRWLPELIRLEDFEGNDNDYEAYFNVLYDVFKNDFINNTPSCRGKNVILFSNGMSLGKDNNFWHIITKKEYRNTTDLNKRPPYIRRCERIRWPRAIIENVPNQHIYVWNELDSNSVNVREHLWLRNFDYIVVLVDKKSYYFFLTAYYVDSEHARQNLQRRYDRYK